MGILAEMSWAQWFWACILIAVCLLLMLVILIQKGRGSGLAGAFGGAGGGPSAFGAKTGDVFTWITVGLAAAFVLFTVVANYFFDMTGGGRALAQQQTPAATAPAQPGQTGQPPAGAGPATDDAATQPGAAATQPADQEPTGDESGIEVDAPPDMPVRKLSPEEAAEAAQRLRDAGMKLPGDEPAEQPSADDEDTGEDGGGEGDGGNDGGDGEGGSSERSAPGHEAA